MAEFILSALEYWNALEPVQKAVAIFGTLVIPPLAGLVRWFSRRQTKKTVERYLKAEKAAGKDKGQRTILHCATRLGLSEKAVARAAKGSRCIRQRLASDPRTGLASVVLLEYRKAD